VSELAREKGETLSGWRIRQLEEHVKSLQNDLGKIKERLMLFFFILLGSNVLSPEVSALLRMAFPH
jgi:hypothetical protein